MRETIEAVVTAVILAFLFRGFEAEAFVIPTGSMAPTLMGRHFDVECPMCRYRYRSGASSENPGNDEFRPVSVVTCPICRFPQLLDKQADPDQQSFSGDRILVSKFAYEVGEPERFDVIVFKYPGNAKQNYIKRLIGLPEESLRIWHGDIYVQSKARDKVGTAEQIARKPPAKVKSMLQLVHDTRHVPALLRQAGWPSRWQDWSAGPNDQQTWRVSEDHHQFTVDGNADRELWLRYRHLLPAYETWEEADTGETLSIPPLALITDYYAYNDTDQSVSPDGMHWVGDLALECDVEVQSDKGELLLDLVEGGVHYECRIDVAIGQAKLAIRGESAFVDANGKQDAKPIEPVAQTKLLGPGKYELRFANVDSQLILWINDRVVKFNAPTTYRSPDNVKPRWSETDPGDAEPAGVGSKGAKLNVTRLAVLRDVYYIAHKPEHGRATHDYEIVDNENIRRIYGILFDQEQWSKSELFDSRREIKFELEKDQFFPLGDNSPASKDARLWTERDPRDPSDEPPPPYVERRFLTGKAVLIYWPHSWRRPVPFTPNLQRMKFIR